jgi:pilus assembly protein CpaC
MSTHDDGSSRWNRAVSRFVRALPILLLFASFGALPAAALESTNLDVPLGGTRRIHTGLQVRSVSVGGREIADVAAFQPDELVISGKRIGETEIQVIDRGGEVHTYVVRIGLPLSGLRDQLQRLFSNDKISISSVGASVVISGQVGDSQTATEVRNLVEAYVGSLATPGSVKISNLLTIAGTPQVQLEVRFAEVSRIALRQIGFNFWTNQGTLTGGLLSAGTAPQGLAPDLGSTALQRAAGLPVIASPIQGAFQFLFANSTTSAFPLSATLSLLSSRGFAKTLAEPTLVALSGQEASFLAGGEFPVPIPQALGQVVIEYKKFGIQLKFQPFVLGDESIQLKLATSVSDIDPTAGISMNQVTVPGLTQRESSTTVRLRDGQSFAIAGLLSDKMRSTVNKVPLFGDIPLLGTLFRSNSFRREESELLVVVTAHLVQPVGAGRRLAMPGGDEISDPNDLELFLLGFEERHKRAPLGRVGFLR